MSVRADRRHAVGARDSVSNASFTPLADRRSVLDRAHRGDIEGAFGRVRSSDTGPRHTLRRRFVTLLAVMGPGVLVMVADNDAGGLSVYAQAGQDHGLRLLWLLMLLAGVLFVNQEMVARLGAVTGAGHARLIFERFGRRWGWFALADLLVLNLLTIITEFIGVALALGFFGISRYLSVPVAAAVLIVVTVTGSFRRWERAMYALVAVSLVAIPLLVLVASRHTGAAPATGTVTTASGVAGGGSVLFVLALVGTTVAPWQLFFQQSTVVDKRITARWLPYERVDTGIGTVVFAIGAIAVLVACATAFAGTAFRGGFVDAGQVARDLRSGIGVWGGALFAIALLNGSVLGAGAVTLSTSYAIGDVFGLKHSLHRPWRDAPVFHGSFVLLTVVAAGVVFIPGAPLGVVTVGVQVLAGVLLPSATVFLLLLCNDDVVLGPWTNPPWLNAVTTVVVAALIVLSALLTTSTLFDGANLAVVAAGLGSIAVVVLAALATTAARRQPRCTFTGTAWERATWTMPPIETLSPPVRSRGRAIGLAVLRAYLVVAAVLVVVRIVQSMVGV
jgi:NRAMP (natural resistance-associated macrophage protein)-like metal ion transporter